MIKLFVDSQPHPHLEDGTAYRQVGPTVPALGVDSDKGTVHGMTTAAANMHEVAEGHNLLHGEETVVCGDADYQGVLKRKEH